MFPFSNELKSRVGYRWETLSLFAALIETIKVHPWSHMWKLACNKILCSHNLFLLSHVVRCAEYRGWSAVLSDQSSLLSCLSHVVLNCIMNLSHLLYLIFLSLFFQLPTSFHRHLSLTSSSVPHFLTCPSPPHSPHYVLYVLSLSSITV